MISFDYSGNSKSIGEPDKLSDVSAQEFDEAAQRWAGVGPYYAMMPVSFALQQVRQFTLESDVVIDPFCGRGTVPFAAAALGRSFFGIDIFPVGWIYASVKCNPARQKEIDKRLEQIARLRPSAPERSDFFKMAYAPQVLRFLCSARENLDWRRNKTDRTLMALILICLHDKKGAGLSNQMRQTKSVHPRYAVRWWKRHRKMTPPDIDPVEVLRAKIKWRYAKGITRITGDGRIYLGDCTQILPRASRIGNVKLLLTSPPYYGVTNYYADQWLRNWMLGGPSKPSSGNHACMKRFANKEGYRLLLQRAFTETAKKLREDAVVLVRTDARTFARETTQEILQKVFPGKHMTVKNAPLRGRLSQTALFGDKTRKPGEVDILLQ